MGITGHRAGGLSPAALDGLGARLADALGLLTSAGRALHERESRWFAADPPRLRFVSPMADGSDQIAAEVALGLGWELQAVLPFAEAEYRESLGGDEARQRFDALIARAGCRLELPGRSDRELDAYIMAGRATVAHCDILIAVWDGLPPRGRGGTGEVVQLALTHGTAVVHLHPDANRPSRLLWSAFDPAVLTLADDVSVERPVNRANVEALLGALLLPPSNSQEQAFVNGFTAERLPTIRTRIEYPLLLAATGVAPFGAKDIAEKHCAERISEEWRRFNDDCTSDGDTGLAMAQLEQAYSWADRLATHFAQSYRSGHIFNFVLGGIAVCLGLSAFVAPDHKFAIAAVEFFITLAIILNAHVGTRNEWHRRWLDYRQLAERLRPMRSLKLLGIAAPDPPGTAANPVPYRWIDWYASGVWRAMGCTSGSLTPGRTAELAAAIADHEVAPQVAYHRRNARKVQALDTRLGKVGFALFAATLLVSVATLIGLWRDAPFVNLYGDWFTLVSAGFPALGTAVFGIRFQADFGGDAVRSAATADTLRQIETEMRKDDVTLLRAADLVEQAGRVMLADLDEWRLVNQQRDLSVG